MDSLPRILRAPRTSATPETEAEVLANAYAFLFQCHEDWNADETKGDGVEEAAERNGTEGIVSEERTS
jgi:hypothetical protein